MADFNFDVDGVMSDIVSSTLRVLARHYNENAVVCRKCKGHGVWGYDVPRRNEITTWDFKESLPQHYPLIKTIWERPDFWENLDMIPGAYDVVRDVLAAGHTIHFVTAPYERCPGWADARLNWLSKRFEMLFIQAHKTKHKAARAKGAAWAKGAKGAEYKECRMSDYLIQYKECRMSDYLIQAPTEYAKAKVHGDIFVDDKPANIHAWRSYWKEHNPLGYHDMFSRLFDAHFNQLVTDDERRGYEADGFVDFVRIGHPVNGWTSDDISDLLDLARRVDAWRAEYDWRARYAGSPGDDEGLESRRIRMGDK